MINIEKKTWGNDDLPESLIKYIVNDIICFVLKNKRHKGKLLENIFLERPLTVDNVGCSFIHQIHTFLRVPIYEDDFMGMNICSWCERTAARFWELLCCGSFYILYYNPLTNNITVHTAVCGVNIEQTDGECVQNYFLVCWRKTSRVYIRLALRRLALFEVLIWIVKHSHLIYLNKLKFHKYQHFLQIYYIIQHRIIMHSIPA